MYTFERLGQIQCSNLSHATLPSVRMKREYVNWHHCKREILTFMYSKQNKHSRTDGRTDITPPNIKHMDIHALLFSLDYCLIYVCNGICNCLSKTLLQSFYVLLSNVLLYFVIRSKERRTLNVRLNVHIN